MKPTSKETDVRPFEIANELTEGDMGAPAPPTAATPVDEVPRNAENVTTGKRKKEKGVPEPDEELVVTITLATDALTDAAVDLLDFSEPGQKWRAAMGRLAARWVSMWEDSYIKTHPVQGAALLHAGLYVGPNAIMRTVELVQGMIEKRRQRQAENEHERSVDGVRSEAQRKDNGSPAQAG